MGQLSHRVDIPFPLFDADNHLYEPPEALTKFLPKEYKDVVPLIFPVLPPAQVHYGKAPRTTDTLAGLKVGVAGRVPSQLVTELGGSLGVLLIAL